MGKQTITSDVSGHMAANLEFPAHAGLFALADALDRLAQPVCIWNLQGKTGPLHGAPAPYFNASWQQYTGLSLRDLSGAGWLQCLYVEDRSLVPQDWRFVLRTGGIFSLDCRILHNDGQYRWCHLQISSDSAAPAVPRAGPALISFHDVHDRMSSLQRLRESVAAQRSMLDASVDCIKIIGTDGALSHMNRSGCEALGVSANEPFGMPWLNLLPSDVRDRGKRALHIAGNGKNARFAGKSVIDGRPTQHWDNILTPMKAGDGSTLGILCVSRDVSTQKRAQQRLKIASDTDALTALPNRRAFKARLKSLVQRSREAGQSFALLLLDLDHFKHTNDTLGHPAGDHLLRILARRLNAHLPRNASLARLGGDEFALTLPQCQDDTQIMHIAHILRTHAIAPMKYRGKTVNAALSMGCAVFPRDAQDGAALMKCADIALHDMKYAGRGGICMFSPAMGEAVRRTDQQFALARHVLNNDLIVPYYEPVVDMLSARVIDWQARLRWRDDTHGMQSAVALHEAFQDFELASQLSSAMQLRVFADMTIWNARGLPPSTVTLPVAPVEFMRDNFAERLLQRLAQHHISTTQIRIETRWHNAVRQRRDYVDRALATLAHAGVRVALNDFGSSPLALTELRAFPLHQLKIDSALVQDVAHDKVAFAIVKGMCQLASDLSLEIVAKGVKTAAQQLALMQAGCSSGIGPLFSEALCASDVGQKLAHGELSLR